MQENNIRFKNLKKRKFKKRKTPPKSKSPTQRQRFITIIRNVTERKRKKLKTLTGFLSANKIDNYNGGEERKSKKGKKNPKESTEQVKR